MATITTSTPCGILIAEFQAIENTLEEAVKGPMRMLNAVNRIIRNTALETLQAAQAEIDKIAQQIGLVAVEDTLAWMKTCLMVLKNCSKSIAENPLIQNAVDVDLAAIDDVTNPNQLPGFSRRYIENKIKNEAYRELDQALGAIGLGSKIGKTQARYLKQLKAAGILDGLDLMRDIITCMEMVCNTMGRYPGRYQQFLDMLRLNEQYEVVGVLWPSATAAQQTSLNAMEEQIKGIETMIDQWSL